MNHEIVSCDETSSTDKVEGNRVTAHAIIDELGPENLATAVMLLTIPLRLEAEDRGITEVPAP